MGQTAFAQDDSQGKKAKAKKEKKEKSEIRTGWTFGILPSVAYDADKGFQYGIMSNIYDFGDGSTYPEYKQSMRVEAAFTTKRSGIFRFSYDTKQLIPNHRLSLDAAYLPDALCDFYGYNGYQSVYNPGWCRKKSDDYISRAFYKSLTDVKDDIHTAFLRYFSHLLDYNIFSRGFQVPAFTC